MNKKTGSWIDNRTSLEWCATCVLYDLNLDETISQLNADLPAIQHWRIPSKKEATSLIDTNKIGSAFLPDDAEKVFKDNYANMVVKTREGEYEKIFSPFYGSIDRFYPGCNPKVRLVRGKMVKTAVDAE